LDRAHDTSAAFIFWIRTLVVLILACPARAVDPAASLRQLNHMSWSIKDGAPPGIFAIAHTLEQTNWVVGGRHGAAERLGLPRTTLMYRMQKLGLSRETQLSRNSMAAAMFAQRAAQA